MLLAVGIRFETWKHDLHKAQELSFYFFFWLRICEGCNWWKHVLIMPFKKNMLTCRLCHTCNVTIILICPFQASSVSQNAFCETPFRKLLQHPCVPVLTPLISRSYTKPGRDNDDSFVAYPSLSPSTFLSSERQLQLSLGLTFLLRWHQCWRAGRVLGLWL